MDTFVDLKGGELRESNWKCKDALRKTVPVETNVNLTKEDDRV
jgi:hypothetical protein